MNKIIKVVCFFIIVILIVIEIIIVKMNSQEEDKKNWGGQLKWWEQDFYWTQEDTSYLGCYAKLEDGSVGIIYVDLAFEENELCRKYYTEDKKNKFKEYIIWGNYNGPFGKMPMLEDNNDNGIKRFYVLKLSDEKIGESRHWNWYYGANQQLTENEKLNEQIIDKINVEEFDDFGQGKEITQVLISKWNAEELGKKNTGTKYKDIWSIFKDNKNSSGTIDSNKWFVPSKGEWNALVQNLEITKDNYIEKGFNYCPYYWTSTPSTTNKAYYVDLEKESIEESTVDCGYHVRLSTIF